MGAGGDAAGVAETRGDPTLVKALARAFRWRRMLEEERYGSIRELAAAEGVDRAYVGRLLKLTLLAPEVVEAILNGCHVSSPVSGRRPVSRPEWVCSSNR